MLRHVPLSIGGTFAFAAVALRYVGDRDVPSSGRLEEHYSRALLYLVLAK